MNDADLQFLTGILQKVRPSAIEDAAKILTEADEERMRKAEEKRERKREKARETA